MRNASERAKLSLHSSGKFLSRDGGCWYDSIPEGGGGVSAQILTQFDAEGSTCSPHVMFQILPGGVSKLCLGGERERCSKNRQRRQHGVTLVLLLKCYFCTCRTLPVADAVGSKGSSKKLGSRSNKQDGVKDMFPASINRG